MTSPGSPVHLIGQQGWAAAAATSRAMAVTEASPAGETRILHVGINGALTIASVTDSAGGVWVQRGSTAVGPSGCTFTCDGATGGPGGGPTALLPVGGTVTFTYAASNTSATQCICLGGYLGRYLAAVHGAASVAVTPGEAGATIISTTNGNPPGAGTITFTGVMATGLSWYSGNQMLGMGYGSGGPGAVTSAFTATPTGATWRQTAIAFAYLPPPAAAWPLKVFDGQGWRDLSAPGALAFDGQDWLPLR